MAKRNTLTDFEVSIIKKLLSLDNKPTNQEIAGLINRSRGGASSDVNSGRITNIKQNDIPKYVPVKLASDDELAFFFKKLDAFDPQTGLNFYDDERLIRSRESMLLAVQVFNSPALKFKTEVFSVLANVAWTYLMHEHFLRKGIKLEKADGLTHSLSWMLEQPECPVSDGMKANLRALKEIRDSVEHRLFGKSDLKWLGVYQACCLNYDKTLIKLFGEKLSLQHDLSFALQFSKLSFDQISTLQDYEIPEHIKALDARLEEELTDHQKDDIEYQFRVVYTLDSSSKGRAHIKFVHPNSEEAEQIRNVLVKTRSGDETHPLRATKVVQLVSQKSGKKFTTHNHTQAWRKLEVRPRDGVKRPENTTREYCIYHPTHKDYTYSEEWVDRLVELVNDDVEFEALKEYRLQ
jgi:Domain of unknown function (DUF3644)